MVNRYRTVLKKFYITESENQMLKDLVLYSGLGSFSYYARKMLFKKVPTIVNFDDTSFDALLFSLRRIINNLNQLSRIAKQSQNMQALNAITYGIDLLRKYEKELIKSHQKKKKKLLSKVG